MLFSIMTGPVYTPTISIEVFSFLPTLITFCDKGYPNK
jgi:hypothetical protein